MPRRRKPHPLARAVGARIKELRKEKGLTLEKLAYEGSLGSKGHLSDLEKGLAVPNIQTLAALAERLDVLAADLLVLPQDDERQRLIDLTRFLTPRQLARVARDVEELVARAKRS
ncbi:MAG: helix-turn-helix transcriptional regulator [Labilithrix sp.]|nr:helix-turn-helix transcriptional regulator [Labilithrix sp.]MBX3214316.1 helix-turn-helix transcriptional regulator [Labilithrix sp.]